MLLVNTDMREVTELWRYNLQHSCLSQNPADSRFSLL